MSIADGHVPHPVTVALLPGSNAGFTKMALLPGLAAEAVGVPRECGAPAVAMREGGTPGDDYASQNRPAEVPSRVPQVRHADVRRE